MPAGATIGAVIVVSHLDEAVPLVDRLAPEHLELAVAEPDALAARIRNAGAIFLGRHTPEAIGDYVAGPNHVLPTARSARFSSGLNLLDFMKRTTLVGCDPGQPERHRSGGRGLGGSRRVGRPCVVRVDPSQWSSQVTTQVDNENHRIIHVALDERSVVRRSAEVEHERAVAIFDLLEDNLFRPEECPDAGPFRLHLSMEDNRMLFDIRNAENGDLTKVLLPLTPFRSIVRDYFMICDSYYKAIKKATPSQIEAIDMGRRGLAQRRVGTASRASGGQGGGGPQYSPTPLHPDLHPAYSRVTGGRGERRWTIRSARREAPLSPACCSPARTTRSGRPWPKH